MAITIEKVWDENERVWERNGRVYTNDGRWVWVVSGENVESRDFDFKREAVNYRNVLLAQQVGR